MARRVVLLRGINIGSRNRIAMPALRELLTGAGYVDVTTYVQSGNVVLSSSERPDKLERNCEHLIFERFGLSIAVVARTRNEFAAVVERNHLGEVAESPKRYQVSFLREQLEPEAVDRLIAAAIEPERVVVDEREVYAWHPEGVARSKLWAAVASPRLGVVATARNWTTVTTLLEMADA